jgi:sn1-specific diacylglycerol lipase
MRTQSLMAGELEDDEKQQHEHRRQRDRSFARCCRSLCCCVRSEEGGSESAAFDDVGRLLSAWFDDFDLVPTDLAAMLYAVHVDQDRARMREERRMEEEEGGQERRRRYPHECTDRPRFGEDSKDQLLLCRIVDNVRFAYGVYGWMLHSYDGMASCSGCRLLCCGAWCCHCCVENVHTRRDELEDCCCPGLTRCHGYNTAAMVELAGIEADGVVYVSWRNDVSKYSPYAIMVDHKTRQVVVACRGTLSMADCVTDVLATETSLDDLGNEFEFQGKGEYGHKGIFGKGVAVARHLEQMGYLRRLLSGGGAEGVSIPPKAGPEWVENLPNCKGYELLITGHSLGAGLATVVSLVLKSKYPQLVCFAYSPPGGMMTMSLAKRTRSFVTSVVVADDMVSRLGVHTMFRLREDMFDVAPRMRNVTKATLLWKMAMGSDVPELLPAEEEVVQRGEAAEAAEVDVSAASVGADKSSTKSISKLSRIPTSVRRMYPPGWLLHLRQVSEMRPCLDTCCCNGCFCLSALVGAGTRELVPVWLNQDGLQEVVVSRTMASDHFPDRVVAALRQIRPRKKKLQQHLGRNGKSRPEETV